MKPSPTPPWTLRARVLQFIDRLLNEGQTPPATSTSTAAPLAPFLNVVRRLRGLSAGKGNKALDALSLRARMRRDMLSLRAGFELGDVRDICIETRAGLLEARLYTPCSKQAGMPLLVYFHGGGFIMGDVDTHDDACRLICEGSGMQVLSVGYRLAPEHPFPAAVDDAMAAARWALAQCSALGASGVALGGDSAGANLAAVTAIQMAHKDLPVVAQLLIYPGTDRTRARPSHTQFGSGYFLDAKERDLFYRCYLAGRPELEADWRVSPLLAECPQGLAPALLVTAGHDMLRDEGLAYAQHLTRHGTAVRSLHYAHLAHGFINLASVHRQSHRAVQEIAVNWRRLCLR